MREIPFRPSPWMLVIAAAMAVAAQPAEATSISKSYEFGPGLTYGTSVVRSFAIPSNRAVTAVVKYRRLSGTGTNDFPIIIELHEPDTDAGVEGPLVEARQVTVKTTEQSVTIQSLPSNRGCSKPWRVRVKHGGSGPAPAQVFGTARLDWDGTTQTVSAGIPGFIGKRGNAEITIGGATGFDEGQIAVRMNWNHMIIAVPGPDPIKMRVVLGFEQPGNQTFVAGPEAYSSNETRAGLPRFAINYNNQQRRNHQWKLWITNLETERDAWANAPTVTFTPVCP